MSALVPVLNGHSRTTRRCHSLEGIPFLGANGLWARLLGRIGSTWHVKDQQYGENVRLAATNGRSEPTRCWKGSFATLECLEHFMFAPFECLYLCIYGKFSDVAIKQSLPYPASSQSQ